MKRTERVERRKAASERVCERYREATSAPAIDELTGLLRYGAMQLLLEEVVSEQAETEETFSVAIIDIDRFELVNRRGGYETGDRCLREIGTAILAGIREDDAAGLIGNGRFVVLLRDTQGVDARSIIERVRAAIAEESQSEMTVSGGIAWYPEAGQTAAALISNAQAALQEAKMRGQNRIGLYDSDFRGDRRDEFTILVVDDNARNRKLMCAILEEPEYDLVESTSADEAVSLVRDDRVDLVISDIRMPGMDGIEFCSRLKASEATRVIPFILVTAHADLEQRVRGIEAGADDFIAKPVDRAELQARVRSLLRIRQHNREATSIESVLFTLINAIEAKDSYTQGHTERVATLATEVGRRMGLSQAALSALRLGGILHDIGKIGIAGDVLNKSGPLTEDEWELMRSHTELGFRICRPLTRNLGVALDIIRHHHEKLDGSSYPDGLAGEQLSVETRITAVVDMYDALTTDRPYRRALSQQEAIRILRDDCEKGKIDPTVLTHLEDVVHATDDHQRRAEDPEEQDMKSVLIIEDDELNMKLVRTLLRLEGYRVIEATDAETGIFKARNERPNLVLMDIQLPGMDGITAASVLRESKDLEDVPIVGISSYAMDSDIKRAMDVGFTDYVTKPIDTDALPKLIRKHAGPASG